MSCLITLVSGESYDISFEAGKLFVNDEELELIKGPVDNDIYREFETDPNYEKHLVDWGYSVFMSGIFKHLGDAIGEMINSAIFRLIDGKLMDEEITIDEEEHTAFTMKGGMIINLPKTPEDLEFWNPRRALKNLIYQ